MAGGENGLPRSGGEPEDLVPDGVKVTKLTEGEYRKLLVGRQDSKSLRDCLEDGHDLVIRNAEGGVLLELHAAEEDEICMGNGQVGHLKFCYYEYDENLKLHLGFSSYGDYNDVHFFVVPEKVPAPEHPEEVEDMDFKAESISIHEATGSIAGISGDCSGGEYALYSYNWDGDGFSTGFDFFLDLPVGIPSVRWIGEHSLLVYFTPEEAY